MSPSNASFHQNNNFNNGNASDVQLPNQLGTRYNGRNSHMKGNSIGNPIGYGNRMGSNGVMSEIQGSNKSASNIMDSKKNYQTAKFANNPLPTLGLNNYKDVDL